MGEGMSRLSLLKKWNAAFTVLVFLLPPAVRSIFGGWAVSSQPFSYYLLAALVLVPAALLWSALVNKVFLPWMVRSRVCWKSALLIFINGYLSITLFFFYANFFWPWKPLVASEVLKSFAWGLLIHIWFFPISLPLFLICLFLNGFVLKFLFERRDPDILGD